MSLVVIDASVWISLVIPQDAHHDLTHVWLRPYLAAGNRFVVPWIIVSEVEIWAEFVHNSGLTLRRPAFWDGKHTWKIRFASPMTEGRWTWRSFSSVADTGLAGQEGELMCAGMGSTAHRFEGLPSSW